MDALRNFSSFKEDIEATFNDLIAEFDLILTEPSEGLFLLKGRACTLKFTYDRGDLTCAFQQITDDKYDYGYQVWWVYQHLYPTREATAANNTNGDWGSPKEQLAGYSKVIQNHLKNILNGDFSWLAEYSKNQNEKNQLTMLVLNLDRSHPISKKFWSGDSTWMADAKNYLAQKIQPTRRE